MFILFSQGLYVTSKTNQRQLERYCDRAQKQCRPQLAIPEEGEF